MRTMLNKTLTTLALLAMVTAQAQERRQLEFRIGGVARDTVYLASYYGNRLYYADTAVADAKGNGVFNSPKGYKAGVYAIVVPGPKYFEIIVNEPAVVVETDTADLAGHLVVRKSEENQIFHAYIKMLNARKKDSEVLVEKHKAATDPIVKAGLKQQLDDMDKAVRDYQNDLIQQHPTTWVSHIVRMSMPVKTDDVRKADGSVDSVASYYAQRAHYWDHVDLKDQRILRTPVFQNKLEEYMGKVVPQIPDTLNKMADELIGRLGDDPEIFKFVVHNITYKYETSDIMGMDAVFTHMALTYYCPKPGEKSKAFWMPDDKLDKMCERARKMAPLVIGASAKDIILPDTTEQNWISMRSLPNDFIFVVFWEPHCGHCKKALPVLYKDYVEKLKPNGIEVYAVGKATDSTLFADWKKFIVEHKLDWVNVGLTWNVYNEARKNSSKYIPRLTTIESLNYGDTWDVDATPKFFLIDGDRKIAGKQISADQVVDLVKRLREQNKKKKVSPEQ